MKNTPNMQVDINNIPDKMLEYIKLNKRATFLDLQVYIGNQIQSDYESGRHGKRWLFRFQEIKTMTLGDWDIKMKEPYNNIVLWPGLSLLFIRAFDSILDKVKVYESSKVMYKDKESRSYSLIPTMPIIYVPKEVDKPHWIPSIICPTDRILMRRVLDVKRFRPI